MSGVVYGLVDPRKPRAKVCVRCEKLVATDVAEIDQGFTICKHCKQDVCCDCTLLLPDTLGDDGVAVCFVCWEPFLQTTKINNTSLGERDAKDSPLGRLILTGVVDTDDGTTIPDGTNVWLHDVKQNGEPYLFPSTDFTEEPFATVPLEMHAAWEPLAGKRIEISCRLKTRREMRESNRGNPYWVDSPYLTLVKVLRIVNEARDAK